MPVFLVDVNRTRLLSEPLTQPDDCLLATRYATVYAGCEYGCVFCQGWAQTARPFSESVRMMAHIGSSADQELAELAPREVVAINGDSDPYQPAERKYRRTQAVLKAFARHKRPVTLMTRSELVLDDLALLKYIHQHAFAMVVVSVLSHSSDVTGLLEPKLASTAQRLAVVKQLREAGIPVGVCVSPLIPYINDTDYALRQTMELVRAAQPAFVYWEYQRLPHLRIQERLTDVLMSVNGRTSMYMRDLYKGQSTIQAQSYLAERNQALLALCDEMRLPVRLPYEYFRGRFDPRLEVSMVLRHHAARDNYAGRTLISNQGMRLAQQVWQGDIDEDVLRTHPAFPLFRDRLGQ